MSLGWVCRHEAVRRQQIAANFQQRAVQRWLGVKRMT